MSAPLVVDASALVALLLDASGTGEQVASALQGADLCAPDLVLVETANVLRRQQLRGAVPAAVASLAHEDLLALPVQLWPYVALAERAWALRGNLTVYDASYVALAELLGARLVTLDARLARADGPRCEVVVPSAPG